MAGSIFGEIFRVTTFGESHGDSIGVVLDGVPSNLDFSVQKIQAALDRRKPGQNSIQKNPAVTSRKEKDEVQVLSGVFEGKTLGTPIALLIKNTSQISSDYENLKNAFRPGHADFTFYEKYGIRDWRGGGRSSGRETAARVAAGAVAQMILDLFGVQITAYTEKAAGIKIQKVDFSQIEQNAMRAPDNDSAKKMLSKISEIAKNGNSAGGVIACVVRGCKVGLGECVFDKADALLSHAMLSIGAIKGIEFGAGFACSDLCGSENNDLCEVGKNGKIIFKTNNAGGILGGMTNGQEIFFRVAVKPVPSIFCEQNSVCKIENGFENTKIKIHGRHDVCLCPRIVPVVEAMTAITLADLYLRDFSSSIEKFPDFQ